MGSINWVKSIIYQRCNSDPKCRGVFPSWFTGPRYRTEPTEGLGSWDPLILIPRQTSCSTVLIQTYCALSQRPAIFKCWRGIDPVLLSSARNWFINDKIHRTMSLLHQTPTFTYTELAKGHYSKNGMIWIIVSLSTISILITWSEARQICTLVHITDQHPFKITGKKKKTLTEFRQKSVNLSYCIEPSFAAWSRHIYYMYNGSYMWILGNNFRLVYHTDGFSLAITFLARAAFVCVCVCVSI